MKRRTHRLIGWFNLRTLVLLLALTFILLPETQRPRFLEQVDSLLFRLGGSLVHFAPSQTPITLIGLPRTEVNALQRDLGYGLDTYQLLKQLASNPNLTIGLVLPNAPHSFLFDQRSPIADASSSVETVDEKLRAFVTSATGLRNIIERSNVHVAVLDETQVQFQGERVALEPSDTASGFERLARWRRSTIPALPVASAAPQQLPINTYFAGELNKQIQALLFAHGDRVVASLPLALYAHAQNSDVLSWQFPKAIKLDTHTLPTSADGGILVARNLPRANVVTLTMDAALQQNPSRGLAILAPESSSIPEQIANTFISLDAHAYFYTPFWFALIELGLLLVAAVYLLLLLPRISIVSGVLISCILLIVLVVVQLGWQITQSQWLPLGLVLQYLVLGHFLMAIWKTEKDKTEYLQAAAHGARYQLGLQLFREGRSDDALLAIRECFASDAVLALMYDIASQQERKRLYGEAVRTYQGIVARRKSYRDAAQKVEKLIAFGSGGMSISHTGEIAKTLIISESTIHKPVIGRYEVERELGRGAMGVVYLGRDPKIARLVAIKTLSYNAIEPSHLDEFKERFFREAEAAGRLSHPNIVTVYDVGEEHDLAFIAMDYIKGSSLASFAKADELLPADRVCEIVAEVAEALHYAHGKQIIHRDIKPGNIMYEPETGKVKVTDFGIARMADSARTSTGDILGSPLYMSPEQVRGGKVTQQTDIFSLGVSLYQLLTGALPFEGDSMAALSYNIIHEKHKALRQFRPDLPSSVTRIINRALQKDSTKRYPSAGEMAQALRKALLDVENG